ncbi:MAG TPA: hypothetical protein VK498_01340 [Ferruginibacter sp.]|nr:hypothetical protein [Ferruginibacter sp.]
MKKTFLLLCFIVTTSSIYAQIVTLTSSTVAAANIAQSSSNNIVYIVKMDVAALPVTVNSITFTLAGTHDADDLTSVVIYFNPTAPNIPFVQPNGSTPATFAAPHTYSFTLGNTQSIAAGASGYFIIAVNIPSTATGGNTVKLNGLTNPVSFGYTTSPTITNNQTDVAGTQTILAAGVTLTSSSFAAATISQGSSNNIVYIVKMDVTTLAVNVNSIQFTLTGNHDADDLTTVVAYFNPSAPTIPFVQPSGSSPGTFAAPHTYTLSINESIAAGASGYFIISVTTAAAATSGNTVKINGLSNPVTFGYTTSPTITNSQTDAAGTQTIQAAGITLTSSPVAAANILQGTNNNIVYIVKMDVATLPVTVNSIQFTLTGTYDNNDITTVTVYFNASAPTLTGASFMNSTGGLFDAPHMYTLGLNQIIAAGASGYFIITVNIAAAATSGNFVKLNGALSPVIFGFSSSPAVTNNQTDAAGSQTISSPIPLTLISFTGNVRNAQEVQLQWITAWEINTKYFEVEWSDDGQHFTKIILLPAAGISSQNLQYGYLHKMAVDGYNYYRLKMIDIDGRFTYSPVVNIKVAVSATKIAVFQNPVIDFLEFRVMAVKNETIVMNMFTSDGKAIASKSFTITKGNNQLSWSMQLLAPGNYFISPGNNQFETIRVMKN